MPEILTESFCERCGTRYTFESVDPHATRRFGRFKTLSRGLKNFVLSDDQSLDEAFAAARSELERETTSQQLDAFHKTFNFCMTCRQYTCANCWNEVEGRCLTCAPHLGHDILPAPFEGIVAGPLADAPPGMEVNGHEPAAAGEAWPSMDLERDDRTTETWEPVATVEPEPVVAEPVATVEPEPVVAEPVATVEPEASPAPAPSAPTTDRPGPARGVEERAAAAAAQTADLLARFRPGQSLDAAIAEYEASIQHDPAASGQVPVAPSLEPEPAPATHSTGVRGEPAAASAGPVPEPASPGAPVEDRVEQPGWTVVAPDVAPRTADGLPAPTVSSAPPRPQATPEAAPQQWPASPQWPAKPQWPSHQPSSEAPVLSARPGGGSIEDLWAASNREVAVAPPGAPAPAGGVQSCVSCGLSLSATARFCRRCGTRQG